MIRDHGWTLHHNGMELCPRCSKILHHEFCDTLDEQIKGKPCNCKGRRLMGVS